MSNNSLLLGKKNRSLHIQHSPKAYAIDGSIYVQRTISGISHLFHPLETAIRNTFIPAILGRPVSDIDRIRLALPLRHGGLGVQDPTETSDVEFRASCEITEHLTQMIYDQDEDIQHLDKMKMKIRKAAMKLNRDRHFKEVYKTLWPICSGIRSTKEKS